MQIYGRDIHSYIQDETKLFGSWIRQSCTGSGCLRHKGVNEECQVVHRNVRKDEEVG